MYAQNYNLDILRSTFYVPWRCLKSNVSKLVQKHVELVESNMQDCYNFIVCLHYVFSFLFSSVRFFIF